MFGLEPSLPAKKALNIFKENNCSKIVELGAGLGRDSIYFGKNSINVTALDYSENGIKIINEKIKKENLISSISTLKFDIREDLPFETNSVDACYSHMLYCMALTQKDLDKLNSEIHRILKPGGLNIYTVRNTDDGDYKKGIHRGEDLYEIDGFIIHFFSKDKILNLTNGFKNLNIEYFEEGSFPRKLYFICNKKN
ncbi:class I SAM-dependent methyltransferase [Candidatus Pelagibacter sp.]|jgi:SAM-dependent methyltransferase|nr:class I SAM-dependent methyltransferase [Candidatus Pelagibacter sp.]